MLHSIEFALKLAPAERCQTISLLVTRCVFEIKQFNPVHSEEAPQSPKQSSSAEPNTSFAESLDIFDEAVPMSGLIGKAGENQHHRFGQRFAIGCIVPLDDMSHGDMFPYCTVSVKRNCDAAAAAS
jgi:hypothetical protein